MLGLKLNHVSIKGAQVYGIAKVFTIPRCCHSKYEAIQMCNIKISSKMCKWLQFLYFFDELYVRESYEILESGEKCTIECDMVLYK